MNILKKETIEFCSQKYPEARQSLFSLYNEIRKEKWKSPEDVKNKFPKASIIGNDRVVLNIIGNRYRLIFKVEYRFQRIYLVFFGTHQEYDKIDATEVHIFKRL